MKIYVVTTGENAITVSLNGEAAVAKTVKPTITALANRNFRFECDGIDEEVESYLDIFINGQPLKGSWLSDEEWLSVALFDAIMNKTFTIGSSSPGGLSYLAAEVELNNDQIKALPSSYIEIIAAPGSGKRIKMIAASAILDATAGAYEDVTGASWILLTGDGGYAYSSGFINAQNVLLNPSITICDFPIPYIFPASGDLDGEIFGSYDQLENYDNKGMTIGDDYNGVPDYNGGHADNTLKITIYYTVVDL